MKRFAPLLALPLLAASNAHAQSSITMYGIVDTSVQYVNTGNGYTAAMNSSGQYGTRIGFRGSEDIGGRNKIDFMLENGFNSNDGTFATPVRCSTARRGSALQETGGACAQGDRIHCCSSTRAGSTHSVARPRPRALIT
ncbi:MAG TPA: porin [Paraburkholderia sp.]